MFAPTYCGANGVGGRSKSAEQIYAERKRGERPPLAGAYLGVRRDAERCLPAEHEHISALRAEGQGAIAKLPPYVAAHTLPHTEIGEAARASPSLFLPLKFFEGVRSTFFKKVPLVLPVLTTLN